MDRHWTNHGNPKEHPFIPHDEDWTDNGKGGKTIDSKNARPSPKDAQKPTEATSSDDEILLPEAENGIKVVLGLIFALGIFVLSGGAVSAPVGAFA